MGSEIINILITIFLVFLNGFFVAAEFAIVKVRASQVETKLLTHKNAKSALQVIKNLDAYLSATQLGITLASLALGWVGEPFVAAIVKNVAEMMHLEMSEATLESIAVVIAFSFITVMHIVFGELAPKSIAIRFPEKTTMLLSAPLRVFYLVFRPLIWVLNGFANLILKLMGIPLVHEQDSHTEEEIRMLLKQSTLSGNLGATEHDLIENVFKFDDRTAEQIMVPRTKMQAVDITATLDDVIKIVLEMGHSRMPVYEQSIDKIIGILHTKDVLKAILADKNNVDITKLLRTPYVVPATKHINIILRELQKEHAQMAIVVDEFGGTAGILTMEDILEELVGDIQDEYDNEAPVVIPKSEHEFIVDGLANIDEVNDFLPLNIPVGENYDTLSGYLNEIFGYIPEEKETIENEYYRFTVSKKSDNAIQSVQLSLLDKMRKEEGEGEEK